MKSKLFAYFTGADYVKTIINALSDHFDLINNPNQADIILSLQMGGYQQLIDLKETYPNKKLVTYVWDCYDWIYRESRGYEWDAYGKLCQKSDLILVPSSGQSLRLKQHWNISIDKVKIVKAYAQYFEHDNVADRGYVCNPLREIPDQHLGWIEKACAELDIPYEHGGRKHGQIGRTWNQYKDFIAGASFIVCPWYEASTGGMSLLEGYNLGKEVLICDSPYMGAKEYFGDRANYFKPTYESLKLKLKMLWGQRYTFPSKPLEDKKEFCKQFTVEKMAKELSNAIR